MALPFVIVMLAVCVALMKELMTDPAANPLRHHMRHKGLRDAIRRIVGEEVDTRTGQRNPWGRGRIRFGAGAGRRTGTEE